MNSMGMVTSKKMKRKNERTNERKKERKKEKGNRMFIEEMLVLHVSSMQFSFCTYL